MANRAVRRPPMIDGSATVVGETAGDDGLDIGTRVFHQKFGYGTISAKEGDKLDIAFEKAGRKKVMSSFVTRA